MTVPSTGETATPAPTTAPAASVPASAAPGRPAQAGPADVTSVPSTATDAAIRTHGLTKRFRSGQVAVAGIDIEVPRGAVYGFLGPNGSGKTTTIRMLLGLVGPTDGYAELLGERMPDASASVLPRVGALVEGPAFHPYLSGRANLERLDAADGTTRRSTRAARIDASLARLGLGAAASKPYRQYSLCMKQRLGLAAALLRPRDLLILDEPTNGLDPQGTREVRSLIRSLAEGGTTVFVSSHLLSEIEQMCSHVAVMRSGRLVAQGALDELRAAGRSRAVLRVAAPDAQAASGVLARLGLTVDPPEAPGAVEADADDRMLVAELPRELAPERVVAELVAAEVRVRGFAVQRPSLEDLFVELTGEGFDVAQ